MNVHYRNRRRRADFVVWEYGNRDYSRARLALFLSLLCPSSVSPWPGPWAGEAGKRQGRVWQEMPDRRGCHPSPRFRVRECRRGGGERGAVPSLPGPADQQGKFPSSNGLLLHQPMYWDVRIGCRKLGLGRWWVITCLRCSAVPMAGSGVTSANLAGTSPRTRHHAHQTQRRGAIQGPRWDSRCP